MAHTFEELKKTTVANLREIAKEIDHEAVRGYSTMHKDELVHAICDALGIEAHIHHEVVGIDKTSIKARIKKLKAKRDEVLSLDDARARRTQLKPILREIHTLKRSIHKATV